jgi:osmotically-inducible protein OsmY
MKIRSLLLTAVIGAFIGSPALIASCASSQKQDSAGQYPDDSAVTAKVKAEILGDPLLKSSPITVDTLRGVVHLNGFVDSQQQARRAGEIAASVASVRSVKNDLIVR